MLHLHAAVPSGAFLAPCWVTTVQADVSGREAVALLTGEGSRVRGSACTCLGCLLTLACGVRIVKVVEVDLWSLGSALAGPGGPC